MFIAPTAYSQIKLPSIFSDHMVLQRGLPIPIWGIANDDEVLEVSFNQIKVSATSDHLGKWKVTLPPMTAGGPFEMTVKSKDETILLEDIYIGEVWLCSGQSNMEWPLRNCTEGEDEIPLANNPLIRFWHLKKKHDTYNTPYSEEQLAEFSEGNFFHEASWELSTSKTAAEFSGVGYFFGNVLHDSLEHMAVGLIQAAVGGSPAQSWVDEEALAIHPQLESLVSREGSATWLDSEIIHPWLAVRAKENWGNWDTSGNSLPGHPFAPGYLYESAIKSIAPFALRGAIWYQGESNATHPESYPRMIEVMLESWRSLWGQGDFPFYFVQLPKIGNRNLWPEFRQAQEESLTILNTGMVVTIDQGHPTDVHPREKKEIGQRLANLALLKTYSRSIPAESPRIFSFTHNIEERKFVLQIDHAYEGLSISDGQPPKGFYLQGYIDLGTREVMLEPEDISVSMSEITVSYPQEFLPTSLKYAWAPFPESNIVNSSGLPLAPFKLELR